MPGTYTESEEMEDDNRDSQGYAVVVLGFLAHNFLGSA